MTPPNSCRLSRRRVLALGATITLASPAQATGPWRDLDPARIAAIASWLPETPRGLGPAGDDRGAWGNPVVAARLGEITRLANSVAEQPFPPWRDDDYLEFLRNGQRTAGERMMDERRHRLFLLVVAECVAWSGRFLPAIETALLELIRQPSWTLPAHDAPDLRNFRGTSRDIDLQSAQIALDLAQTLHLLGGWLNSDLRQAVMEALEIRVFAPLRRSLETGRGNTWLTALHNWNAVCLAGVVPAALAVLQERTARAVHAAAAERYIRHYLDGFRRDGYTTEGPSYWNFGFSHFVRLREALAAATGGRLDLFGDAKTRAMALYGFRIEMLPGNVAAFGDAGFGVRSDTLTRAYVDEAFGFGLGSRLADLPIATRWPFMTSPLAQVSLLLFARPAAVPGPTAPVRLETSSWFEEARVLVSRPAADGRLAVTIKAGGNTIYHSHDDVGSYSIGLGREQPVGDPGATRYSAKIFGSERYSLRAINSFGHPVPRVANALQRRAFEIDAPVTKIVTGQEADVFTVDLTQAYAVPALRSLVRGMRHERADGGRITIEDRFAAAEPIAFESALITRGEWRERAPAELEFRRGGEMLLVGITASAPFALDSETVDEEGLIFTRIAIRLQSPQSEGFVRVQYRPGPLP